MSDHVTITYRELMDKSLKSMLTRGETLSCPLYGCYEYLPHWHAYGFTGYAFGYVGLTENALLIARLYSFHKDIREYRRESFPLKKIKVRKKLISRQTIMTITPQNGKTFKIHVANKVKFIGDQRKNLEEFIQRLNTVIQEK